LVILIAVVIIVFVFTYKGTDGKDKSYTENLVGALDKADELSLDLRVGDIKKAFDSYYGEKNQYPDSLEALIPEFLRHENQLDDPWGTRFNFEKKDDSTFMLISAGKDRTFGTKDDITRSLQ